MLRQQNQRKNLRNSKSKAHLDSTFRAKRVPIRVAHHKHTGRRLPFYCTSYAALFFIIIFTSTLVLLISNTVKADEQGSIDLSGLVKGPPPDTAASITYPAQNSRFTDYRIELRGTCQPDTYVEIYRKNIFAGMTTCSTGGDFIINVTLVPGENLLVAKTRDAMEQYGPDSTSVKVFLDTLNQSGGEPSVAPQGGSNEGYLKPMLIYTDPVQKGVLVGQSIRLDYEVDGNEPPYTIAIDWGDGSPTTLVKHDDEGDFSASHTYETSGQRTVQISGIGSKGGKAYIQTIVVVHGQDSATGLITSATPKKCSDSTDATFSTYCYSSDSSLVKITEIIWPALIVASLMTVSFWVGEKMMLHQLKPKH